MEKVPISELREGMRVGQTVHSEQGPVLLAQGTALTRGYIASLASRGFLAIYIQDGIGDDVQPEEVVSQQVRHAVHKHLRDLFTVSPMNGQSGKGSVISNLRPSDPQIVAIYEDVKQIVQEVMNNDSISGVASIKSHDNYTFEHSVEVTVAGLLVGKRLGLQLWDLHQLALGCLCHDVGKTTVPPEILNKAGRLTREEFELVKQHPVAGYEAARKFMKDDDIIARGVVWQHHERQDGFGYPRGLMGTNYFEHLAPRRIGGRLIIPAAEIAAVADVYSALASDRPYRPAMEPRAVAQTIREMAGSNLNAEVVQHFLAILPIYPVGTKVVVTSGKLGGWSGVVTGQNHGHMDRPVIRLVADSTGRMVAPRAVDTSKETDVELAAPRASGRRMLGELVRS